MFVILYYAISYSIILCYIVSHYIRLCFVVLKYVKTCHVFYLEFYVPLHYIKCILAHFILDYIFSYHITFYSIFFNNILVYTMFYMLC